MPYTNYETVIHGDTGGSGSGSSSESSTITTTTTTTDSRGNVTVEVETMDIGMDTETGRTSILEVSSVIIYPNGTAVDITAYCSSRIEIQDRCDEAFALGTFEAILPSGYSYNIPPYTPLFINGEFFLCKSTCNKLPLGTTYLHTFEVLEGTAILSCFIVGTKSFSTTGWNKFDRKKIDILLTLMIYKYNYNFNFSSLEFYDQIQYDFGAGSTLFDCLTEIGMHYNKRVRVTDYDVSSKTISLEFVKLDAGTSFSCNNIISTTVSQDTDTYGYYLETEASNVVDRTTLTHVTNLTCRAGDSLLNADTAILKLPSKAEEIIDFGFTFKDYAMQLTIKVPAGYITTFDLTDTYYEYLILCHTVTYTKTDGTTGHLFQDLWDEVFSNYFEYDDFMYRAFLNSGDGTFIMQNFTYIDQDVEDIAYGSGQYSMATLLLERSEWDLLTAAEQTEFAVYKSGSDTIENLNATYKDDIWNTLIGATRYPFLAHIGGYVTYSEAVDTITYRLVPSVTSTNPLDYTYYVDYYAIVDPIIINSKTETPLNETKFKEFGRSYNANAGYVDYDKLIENMAISNNSMGRSQLTLELDLTDNTVMPFSRQTFTYRNVDWYISSVVTTYENTHKTCILNCVRNYNKKAEAIGVETQFNKTKNPLTNIVTRPIHINCTKFERFGFGTGYAYYAKLRFEDRNHNSITNVVDRTSYIYLWKRCVCMEMGTKVLFYFEMDDQFCADVIRKASSSSNYELQQCRYVDDMNEFVYVEVTIYAVDPTSQSDDSTADQMADSYLFPLAMNLTTIQATEVANATVYKDARERLTFTLEMEKE